MDLDNSDQLDCYPLFRSRILKSSFMKKTMALVLLVLTTAAKSQKLPIERTWYNAEKTSKIRIFKATDGRFYGKIVWLKEPNDNAGQPRLDKHNPDAKKQNRPLLDLMILTAFSPAEEEGVFEGGKVYDPNNGKTYCGKLTLKGNSIDLRGYICGMSILGRTAKWTLAD
jgi:uncharacterized protein (DUF2147 family)